MKKITILIGMLVLVSHRPSHLYSAESTPEIIIKMIRAHGGMKKWNKSSTVGFTDAWTAHGSTTTRTSKVVVEQDSRRAYLDLLESGIKISWDGTNAWSTGGTPEIPPRFVALLNYYFLNLPWLTQDPGVNLSAPKTKTWGKPPKEYITINMTFDPGVGDTPDDYYLLYIDPETYVLTGCEYIVTYAGILPEGVQATPPHILMFDELTVVGGLRVPTAFKIYDEENKPLYSVTIRDWSFGEPFDPSRMIIPTGARIDRSQPQR